MLTLSIDWEDFGQLLGRDYYGTITTPLDDIDRQTKIILDLLDETGQKATFFILGVLCSYKPELVKEIDQRGHEIGIHGYSHIHMHKLNRHKAYEDIKESINTVNQTTGKKVYGYRAPYFSINHSNLYLLEILAELGIEYDSSIFPMKMPRYGIENFDRKNRLYQLPNGSEIVELPISIFNFKNTSWPVAGGGYMRLLPSFLIKWIYQSMVEKGSEPMVYMHPYEFDNNRIDCSTNFPINAQFPLLKKELLNWKWNLFRSSIIHKLRYLLSNYEFLTCKQKADYVKSTTYSPTILGR